MHFICILINLKQHDLHNLLLLYDILLYPGCSLFYPQTQGSIEKENIVHNINTKQELFLLLPKHKTIKKKTLIYTEYNL